MRDRPSGEALAALALSIDDGDALVSRCLAIAARESSAGEAAFAPMRGSLAARYGAGGDCALLRYLAGEIAAGAFEEAGDARDWALCLLWDITRQKLRESNPEFLSLHAVDRSEDR